MQAQKKKKFQTKKKNKKQKTSTQEILPASYPARARAEPRNCHSVTNLVHDDRNGTQGDAICETICSSRQVDFVVSPSQALDARPGEVPGRVLTGELARASTFSFKHP
jgi:hypothetical protein